MKLQHEVKLTPAQVAEAFCELDDDAQARVFVEIAKIAATWDGDVPQFLAVSRHLCDCKCSTEDARDVVRDLAYHLVPGGTHG